VDSEAEALAAELWSIARDEQQASRRIASDSLAERVRAGIRVRAAADGVKVRTARIGDAVVVVRRDADVWGESAAEMRRKLLPNA